MSSKNSSLKPIKLYNHASGPNPWKIVMALEALHLPYTSEWVDFSKIKEEPYISVNPNGRVPAIVDPNNSDFTLWESGAILQYLVSTYDKSHSISFAQGSTASYLANQWLFFQVSGQGPYYGQAAWFTTFHPEKIPSAIERYQKEAERVVGVVDDHLKRTGLKYLVADKSNPEGKFTYADLSFVPWANALTWIMAGKDIFDGGKYEAYQGWIERVKSQEGVKRALEIQKEAQASVKH